MPDASHLTIDDLFRHLTIDDLYELKRLVFDASLGGPSVTKWDEGEKILLRIGRDISSRESIVRDTIETAERHYWNSYDAHQA